MKNWIKDFLILWVVIQSLAIVIAGVCVGAYKLFQILPPVISWLAVVIPVVLAIYLVYHFSKDEK